MSAALFGEYPCKLDAKGRFLVPQALMRQLPKGDAEFVLNRGLDTCLVLFPLAVWQQELAAIYATNQYVPENRAFARLFQSGAVPAELDGQGRLLVPKRLAEHAALQQDLVLVGAYDRIEIWAAEVFEAWRNQQAAQLPALAEQVMRLRTATTQTHTP